MHDQAHRFTCAIIALAIAASASCAGIQHPKPSAPTDPPGFVVAHDGKLWLDGKPYRFVGVNVYSLASRRGKYFCGMPHSDDQVRAILDDVVAMGGNAVRIDAFQSFTAGGEDFSRIDFILDQAYLRGIRVIMTLENQWPECTEGGYKSSEWYRFGYMFPDGTFRLSFHDYVGVIVQRYRSHPGVLMWQLINEAESADDNGRDDPEPLLAFADVMTRRVKTIDRTHPVSLGTSGILHPGSGSAFFAFAHQLPQVDIVEAHDYHAENEAMPPEIRIPILTARHLGKPFFVGESGIDTEYVETAKRATYVTAKMEAAWQEGVSGYLIWSYRAWDCTGMDFDREDPLFDAIRQFTAKHPVRPATPAP